MDFKKHLGKRIVLTCKNNMSYSGLAKGIMKSDVLHESIIVELDSSSGFSILCPSDFIENITIVPIKEGELV